MIRLKDIGLQQTLTELGFAVMPTLPAESVRALIAGFEEFRGRHGGDGRKHHATFHIGDPELAAAVDGRVLGILRPYLSEHFLDARPFVGNYMVKEPDTDSEVKLHQDWTYVDEQRFSSCNLWIPLQDVDARNGCLHFLPSSHLVGEGIRSSPNYPELFANVPDLLPQCLVQVPMRAGEAVVFYHKTLHGSCPNLSAQRRVNVVQGLMSSDATLQHYFDPGNGTVEVYDIEVNDFYHLSEKNGFSHIAPSRYVAAHYPQLERRRFTELFGPKLNRSMNEAHDND